MTPYLLQAAQHYCRQDLRHTCFVFPSRRAARFFRHHLDTLSGSPMRVFCTSMAEFLHRAAGQEPADRLTLLVELHAAYRQVDPDAEPLDAFVFWGDALLADFDDADKYLAPVWTVFSNAADLRAMREGDLSYLTQDQRDALARLCGMLPDEAGDDAKGRFGRVWNCLLPLYAAFRERLRLGGLSYDGMIYRDLAERLRGGETAAHVMRLHFPSVRRFVFIGLNVLSESERVILAALRDAGMAEFSWDWSSDEIRDPANKASHFLRRNVAEFPQAFDLDTDGLTRPHVNVVGIPSALGQAKAVPSILDSLPGDDADTAVVLPDAGLLGTLLRSVPGHTAAVNVTMGSPLRESAAYAFLKAAMRIPSGRVQGAEGEMVHHGVIDAMWSCALFMEIISEGETEAVAKMRAEARVFVRADEFTQYPNLKRIFRSVPSDDVPALSAYLADVLALATERLPDDEAHEGVREFVRQCSEILSVLSAKLLPLGVDAWMRILDSSLRAVSVPFEGDPFDGLQVTGPLETRAMDWRNVIVLSANENVFPQRSDRPSFIPPVVRKAFGLPTADTQDSLWAYYFYRLIQRAENVWMLYDCRTDGLVSGEESRFVRQLELHYGFDVIRRGVSRPMSSIPAPADIPKTMEHVEALYRGHLSASALQNYLVCPAKFYYHSVVGLREKTQAKDSLDAAMLGNVFHSVMETLYAGAQDGLVTTDYLDTLLSGRDALKTLVRESIMREMNTVEITGRNIVVADVLLDYVEAALRHDRALNRTIRILGLEKNVRLNIAGFNFVGFIDRLDSISPGDVRVVDYKTGHVENDDIAITDDNANAVMDKLFGESNYGRPKIALQLYLYDRMVRENGLAGQEARLVNSIYSTGAFLTEPLRDYPVSEAFMEGMHDRLEELLGCIADTEVPWRRTEDRTACAICPFKDICGR